MNPSYCGQLIIISGPSGVGKSSVVSELLSSCELPLELSVSATTREPRINEVDGVHYHFISLQEFFAKRQNEEFLECAEVFGIGHWYGTLEKPVRERLEKGRFGGEESNAGRPRRCTRRASRSELDARSSSSRRAREC